MSGDRSAARPEAATYYVDPGVIEPYSGGRNSDDVSFRYASRHHPRITPGVFSARRYGAAAPPGAAANGAESAPQALSCSTCRGSECVFELPHTRGELFCQRCNDKAIS